MKQTTEIDAVIPRQPLPMERMLRIHFMQWFNLSDPAMAVRLGVDAVSGKETGRARQQGFLTRQTCVLTRAELPY